MRRLVRVFAVLAVLAVTVVAAGCGGDGGSGTTKIGASLPLTGDFSEPGQAAKQGYEIWQEQVNQNGGLLGRQVQVIIKDDASEEEAEDDRLDELGHRDPRAAGRRRAPPPLRPIVATAAKPASGSRSCRSSPRRRAPRPPRCRSATARAGRPAPARPSRPS